MSRKEVSDLIIQRNVIGSITELRSGIVCSRQQISVRNIIKGNINIGDVIEVLQIGGVLIFGMVRITKTPTIRISDLESISFDYVTIDQNCASLHIRRAEGTTERKILSKEEVEKLFGGNLQEFLGTILSGSHSRRNNQRANLRNYVKI